MKKISDIHTLVGDELLVAVFNQFPKEENLNFKDETNIMLAFYKASRKNKYAALFKNYYFDDDGIAPYSKEIADGINILHQSSLLNKVNPSFSSHRLTAGIDIRFKNFIANKLTHKQTNLLKQLSQEIKQNLK